VAFVGEDDGVVGDVFEQGRRRLAGRAAGEVARVVLDPVADAGGLQHLEIEIRALFQPLRLQQFALADQLLEPRWLQLGLDALDRLLHRRARRHVVRVGVDRGRFRKLSVFSPGQRVELGDALQLVAEEGQPPGAVLKVGGPDLERVAAHAERAALERLVVAAVLLGHQIGHDLALVDISPAADPEGHAP
jgi:hypothetical protein